ncbi:MAG: insulinase family protein [Oscillospiraceae bacterium]|nr:insulinase family protein [Oscillospiraceae bacterium]
MKKFTLYPGVSLTVHRSHKFRTSCFSVNLLRPLCREEASQNALLLEVLMRGSRLHPDMQSISSATDDLYGAEIGILLRKRGEVQCMGLFADFVEDSLVPEGDIFQKTASLVAEILLDPYMEQGALKEDYVLREKDTLADSIRARINNKQSYAVRSMIDIMCQDEAYRVDRMGEEEDLIPITAQSLTDHWKKVLATSRVEILYMGSQEEDTVAEVFRKVLATMPRGELAPVTTEFRPHATAVKECSGTLDVTQGKLCMGFRLGMDCHSPHWHKMLVMNAVYGAGVTSKLFQNVREKRSLCYSVSSSIEKHKGIGLVTAGISFDQYEEAKTAILREWEACQRGEITEEELSSAKAHLCSSLRTQKDSLGQTDDFYLGQAVAGTEETMDSLMEKISTVTKEDVQFASQQMSLDTIYFLKGGQA